MTKRIEKQINDIHHSNQKVRFTLGTIAIVAFCTFLIIIATFSQFSFYHYSMPLDAIFHPIRFSETNSALIQTKYYEYIPQIPVIAFIATLLGPIYSGVAVLLYVVLGLSYFPVFALGGGIKYVMQYGFGYILSFIPAIVLMALILKQRFTFKSVVKAAFLGVLTIHIIGIFYIIILALLKGESYQFILELIVIQSASKFVYDFIFSLLAILFAKLTKKVLWIILG